MATSKQKQAARRNVKKAQEAAAGQKTIAHPPAKTKTALGKQGAAVALLGDPLAAVRTGAEWVHQSTRAPHP
jgi:hypothetical protein